MSVFQNIFFCWFLFFKIEQSNYYHKSTKSTSTSLQHVDNTGGVDSMDFLQTSRIYVFSVKIFIIY